jgi:hypothetical protein
MEELRMTYNAKMDMNVGKWGVVFSPKDSKWGVSKYALYRPVQHFLHSSKPYPLKSGEIWGIMGSFNKAISSINGFTMPLSSHIPIMRHIAVMGNLVCKKDSMNNAFTPIYYLHNVLVTTFPHRNRDEKQNKAIPALHFSTFKTPYPLKYGEIWGNLGSFDKAIPSIYGFTMPLFTFLHSPILPHNTGRMWGIIPVGKYGSYRNEFSSHAMMK